jgi:translation initiation factor IF-1
MPRPDLIAAEARVRLVRSARLCVAELANGHRLWAFVPRGRAARIGSVQVGDEVTLEVSPYDLSKAKIVRLRKTEIT